MPIAHQRPHGHHLRRGRFSQRERIYLVTTITHDRLPRFSDLDPARAVIHALRREATAGTCRTLAWVLMPDHLHWLFVLRDDELSRLVGRLKQSAARSVNRITGRTGEMLWQRGFYDRAVRDDEDVVQMARYIVANPVRAGLVENIGAYPFWDAVWL